MPPALGHPVLGGFVMGILFSANVYLLWRDIIKPLIVERDRKAWDEFHANLKWPPPEKR